MQPNESEKGNTYKDGIEYHLSKIEYHTEMIRGGESGPVSPSDFRIPTSSELREMRLKCGITQKELAEAIDYSSNSVGNYESGHGTPGLEYIRRALLTFRREWPTGDDR